MAEPLELLGVEEVVERIKKLNAQANRVENRAMREAAMMLSDAISQRAPRSITPRQPYGKRGGDSQRWRTGEHAADKGIRPSNVRRDKGGKYILVGVQKSDNSRYFYLKFHEWGSTKMPARPFMEPTAQEMASEIQAKLRDELKAGLGL